MFRPYSFACRFHSLRTPADPEKRPGNMLCGSNNRWREIPAARQESAAQGKISTNCVRHRSAANKMVKDKVPIRKTCLQMRAAWRKARIRPAKSPRAGFPPTRDRGVAFRRTAPAWFPQKKCPLSPNPLAHSLMSNLFFAKLEVFALIGG